MSAPGLRRRELLLAGFGLVAAGCRPTSTAREVGVRIATPLGDIGLALFPERAPATVANFLRYLDGGHYAAGSFYRTVKPRGDSNPVPINVIQGGILRDPAPFEGIEVETTRETGLSHVDGVVSMARMVPGWSTPLATSEFFICIGDNQALDAGGERNADGRGFAAFGRVAFGMDVVRAIHARPTGPGMEGTHWAGQMLETPVRFQDARRV